MSDAEKSENSKKEKVFSVKKYLPRSLLGRSLLILITPVLLIQVVTGFMFFDRHWSKMTMRLAYGVAGEITVLARMIEQAEDTETLEILVDHAGKHLNLRVRFDEGARLEQTNITNSSYVWESMVAHTLYRQLEVALERPFVLDLDFQEKWVQVFVQLENGVMNVALPGRRLFSSSGYIFLLWVLGTSLVLLVIAILFMRNQVRPIRRLAVAAERFGKGREVGAFKPTGAREVRQAAQAFLDMHKRIRRQIDQRTTMLAGVSHDLRTPLTRLKLQLEILGDSPDVDAMKSDIQAMEKMIEGYIEFVRGEGDEQVEAVELRQLLEEIITAGKRLGLDMTLSIKEDVTLMVRPMAFERCLMNLINNAGKYADHVWVGAHIENNKLELAIEDNGTGIPEDQYEEVFRPFYRVDSSRNLETGSVGLGLPIAMEIIHAHGGKIWLEKSNHGGLSVRIRLPL